MVEFADSADNGSVVRYRLLHWPLFMCIIWTSKESQMDHALATHTADAPAQLPLSEAQLEWRRCRPWIKRAMAKSPALETIEDIEENVAAGRAVFWAGDDSALITRIDTFPAGKALVIVYADGDGDHLEMAKHWLPQLEHFARHFDCQYLTVEAQQDDAPLMDALGLRPAFTTWIKEVDAQAPAIEEPIT
jgi:hypothetical protein